MENKGLNSYNRFSEKSLFKTRSTIPLRPGSSGFGLFILCLLFLSGCDFSHPESSENIKITSIKNHLFTNVTRFHDDELNVTCWIYQSSYKGGIQCIPDKDFK